MLLRALIAQVDPDLVEQQETLEYLKEELGERHFPKLPPDFLSSMNEIEDRKPVQSRLSEKTEYLHVSSLLDLCPRQYALTRYYKLEVTEKVNAGQRIIWTIGKSLERHAINNIESYHGKSLVFHGEVIYNDEYGIQGAPDLTVCVDKPVLVAVEIKTMNARDFKQLEAPRGDHVLQAAMYQWLLNNIEDEFDPWDIHDYVILLYIAKDAIRGMSPYKEYQVDTKQPHIQKGVNIALELAREYKEAKEKGMIPRRHICSRQDCSRARTCGVSELCFNSPEEEYDPGIEYEGTLIL